MSGQRVHWGYLRDIREAIEDARQFVVGMSYETFSSDRKTVYASMRALEIIGEAARRLPDEVRELDPSIPWQRMVAFRNVIAHEYDRITISVVWDTILTDLPGIENRIAHIEEIQRRREEEQ